MKHFSGLFLACLLCVARSFIHLSFIGIAGKGGRLEGVRRSWAREQSALPIG